MSDALTMSEQKRETRRAGAVYPTPSPAPNPQRLQRLEVNMVAEKSALDPSATAYATPRPETTGQDSGARSAKV